MDRPGSSDLATGDAPRAADESAVASAAVLVVDDDESVRTFVARYLERHGVVALGVGSGREALRAVADGTFMPTILLTDIEMPAMNGVELAARMTALRPNVRIALMTGDPVSAEVARDHAPRAIAVLLKPVSGAEVLAALGLPGGSDASAARPADPDSDTAAEPRSAPDPDAADPR